MYKVRQKKSKVEIGDFITLAKSLRELYKLTTFITSLEHSLKAKLSYKLDND